MSNQMSSCRFLSAKMFFRVIFWRMYDLNPTQGTPQFTTAEYSRSSSGDRCVSCNQPLTARYYRVNTRMACEGCVQELQRREPSDSHTGYARGLLFGVGAAIVGMAGYAAFTILTGIYIGYVSLAVGWLVGKAIMLGSKGIGGRRYQIAAVILTYAAVSIAAVPIAISYHMKAKSQRESIQPQQQQQPAADAENNETDQMEQLAAHARSLEAHGDFQEAREKWLACLPLLPAQSVQADWIRNHVHELEAGASPQAGHPASGSTPNWVRKLGPLGPILLALLKFK